MQSASRIHVLGLELERKMRLQRTPLFDPHNVVNAAAPKIAASLSGSAEATRSTRPW